VVLTTCHAAADRILAVALVAVCLGRSGGGASVFFACDVPRNSHPFAVDVTALHPMAEGGAVLSTD
jgi:hypothetical protein